MTSGDNSSTVIGELTKRLRANQIGYEDAYQAAIEAADLIERQAAEILNMRSRADRQAGTIASLYQAKASLEREVSRLARQPAAIGNEADDDIEEAREILENMVRSIELHGNYSTEATCTFLRQALNCLPVAAPLANEASKPAPSPLSEISSKSIDADCAQVVDDDMSPRAASTSANVQGAVEQRQQIGTSDEADFERGTWTFRMRPGFIVTAGEYLIVQKRQPAEGGDADPL